MPVTLADALRLGLAMLAGILVGLERGGHAHPAGLRTTILVCIAACLARLRRDEIVRVITTAATIRLVAAIGLCFGATQPNSPLRWTPDQTSGRAQP